MKLIIPVESMKRNKGGVILYNVDRNKIEQQYVHPTREDIKRSGWRGGVLYNNYLITTDWTDLHYFDISNWKYLYRKTKNTFNDLHYLEIKDNILYVVNTGLDAVEEFKNPLKPKGFNFRFVFDQNDKFTKRDLDINEDWNKKLKVKPHSCHPNCICPVRNHLFTTCFENETRKENTGCIIDINSGKILLNNVNCHDGNYYNKNLYLSHTRKSSIIELRKPLNKKWPMNTSDEIKIGKPGWWRGMVINKDKIYLFASNGYKGSGPANMVTINLKTKSVNFNKLPKLDIPWDTIYQPLLFEE